ncbi:hypothetical protein PUNSTDRAFT_137637 [Punctularia strigosozonata HHB-11173 SS5]|uniref:uncharacterized protein n=1 Tax=Punctularia strigosozonata (strain HHB-11173) TaxID=741275 RepID=UPI0004416589|nr:uncharacterized protein PUNSTDRAFT_137637 [Punctularia strigosozonata HHB-11173 SS5]EIN05532.1 hypothetical protein PUNSTDRAFT_137637 [Punctularia strigosozonata HHB-11173 SS5]
MHFGKSYAQLLQTLPLDLRENAIEYRQLKKLIRQIVDELASHGLSPEVLHQLLQSSTEPTDTSKGCDAANIGKGKGKEKATDADTPTVKELSQFMQDASSRSSVRVLYEVNTDHDRIEPRLRIVSIDEPLKISTSSMLEAESQQLCSVGSPASNEEEAERIPSTSLVSPEIIIPLASDSAFFSMLAAALQQLSAHLVTLRAQFEQTLHELSRTISAAARPMSEAGRTSFVPHSVLSDPTESMSFTAAPAYAFFHHSHEGKSDLYAWREIFQLYLDAEIFESTSERSRGERSMEDASERWQAFVDRLKERHLLDEAWLEENGHLKHGTGRLQLKESRKAMFQHANVEALRKILKKHRKRTALPLPEVPLTGLCPPRTLPPGMHKDSLPDIDEPPSLPSSSVTDSQSSSWGTLVLSSTPTTLAPYSPSGIDFSSSSQSPSYTIISSFPVHSASLPRTLVQAIGQELVPMIPQIDDYTCLICTSIAFKPIRLKCGHLFCVRCLVKMQKRGKGNCPMCRAPTVLDADRSNVDWALLNFMKDWFPIEAKEKLKQNEREAAQEELQELGFSQDAPGCLLITLNFDLHVPFKMQSDPLSDTAALRYQYESDEEEDEPFPLGNPATPEQTAGVSFIGSVDPTEHLIVAFGEAGRTWASGADLGEQTGAITVNNIQASFVFVPRWGERRVTVIISEPSGSLPLWAMADYARRILTIVQPKRLSLLDIYPVHVYAASEPITIHGAPIRYLALNSPFEPLSGFDAYEPPNLSEVASPAPFCFCQLRMQPVSHLRL